MTIDQPGLILLSKTATGKLAVSYSDPTQKLTGKVKGSIEINGKSRDLAFTLPEGMKAGSTVTMDFRLLSWISPKKLYKYGAL